MADDDCDKGATARRVGFRHAVAIVITSGCIAIGVQHRKATIPTSRNHEAPQGQAAMSYTHAYPRPDATTLLPGAHLATPRQGFVHHRLYVGNGRVIHYRGFDRLFRRHPVQEVSLTTFAGGRGFEIMHKTRDADTAALAVARARSRLGEDRYQLWSNNCEHFVTWCIDGVARSLQVEMHRSRWQRPLTWLRRIARLALSGKRGPAALPA